MNIILLDKKDIHDDRAIITGKKLVHILSYIKPTVGDTVRAGILNGPIGEGVVTTINDKNIILDINLKTPPPAPLPLKLILAMPRPKVLNRVIQHATSMGIKEIYIIKTWRVEKSYWATPLLEQENLITQMVIGLEQGKDTVMPEIRIKKAFKSFMEDELPIIIKGTFALVAHPDAPIPCPHRLDSPVTLAIGPEGGFIPYEIEALKSIGVTPVSLGDRILRVETAIPFIIGRLF
jgi:16S rRNA (uracil1498-N3)-methyltransferase